MVYGGCGHSNPDCSASPAPFSEPGSQKKMNLDCCNVTLIIIMLQLNMWQLKAAIVKNVPDISNLS
jgi:hypothetical protein